MNDQDERLYIYCITSSNGALPEGLVGIDPERPQVAALAGDGLDVVTSRCVDTELPIDRKHLMAHQEIMKTLQSRGRTVLPVRFNTITDPGVTEAVASLQRDVLGERKGEIDELIDRMRGKVEVGVKVLWAGMPRIYEELLEENPQIRSMRSRARRSGRKPAQKTLVDLGERVKEELQSKKKREARALLERLGRLAADRREERTFGDPMLLNASFLVEDGTDVAQLHQEVESIEREGDGRLRSRCTEPLPISSFVELVIELGAERR